MNCFWLCLPVVISSGDLKMWAYSIKGALGWAAGLEGEGVNEPSSPGGCGCPRDAQVGKQRLGNTCGGGREGGSVASRDGERAGKAQPPMTWG